MCKAIPIEVGIEHLIEEIICINCKYRCIEVRPVELWLKDCVCPKCGQTGYMIATGQILEDEEC